MDTGLQVRNVSSAFAADGWAGGAHRLAGIRPVRRPDPRDRTVRRYAERLPRRTVISVPIRDGLPDLGASG